MNLEFERRVKQGNGFLEIDTKEQGKVKGYLEVFLELDPWLWSINLREWYNLVAQRDKENGASL